MDADSGFEVQADAIVRHAATVDDVADQVMRGRSAASSVVLGRDAYGFLCRVIPALLDPVQEATVDAMQAAVDSLQSSADDLRATARDYTGSDARASGKLGGGAGR